MAEVFMDAAVAALPNKAYFFVYDQYADYDFAAAPKRLIDSVDSADAFPAGSAGASPVITGRDRRIRAALPAKGRMTTRFISSALGVGSLANPAAFAAYTRHIATGLNTRELP